MGLNSIDTEYGELFFDDDYLTAGNPDYFELEPGDEYSDAVTAEAHDGTGNWFFVTWSVQRVVGADSAPVGYADIHKAPIISVDRWQR